MRVQVPAFIAAVVALVGGGPARANLIVNGDFETDAASFGAVGFTSQYAFRQDQLPAGTINVGSNAHADNIGFASFAALGGGNMLIVNGANAPGVQVWNEAGLKIQPNTSYQFSAWAASLNGLSPAMLAFTINGRQIGADFVTSATPGLWQQFTFTWNSGAATTADVGLVNRNTAAIGNDFALDDIALGVHSPAPVPEPASLLLLAAGLPLLVLRRRATVAASR